MLNLRVTCRRVVACRGAQYGIVGGRCSCRCRCGLPCAAATARGAVPAPVSRHRAGNCSVAAAGQASRPVSVGSAAALLWPLSRVTRQHLECGKFLIRWSCGSCTLTICRFIEPHRTLSLHESVRYAKCMLDSSGMITCDSSPVGRSDIPSQ